MNKPTEALFHPGNIVLALDLDHTLAHYRDNMRGFYLLARSLGISEKEVRRAVSFAEAKNFSFETFYCIISTQTHIYVSEEKFVERAMAWFREEYILYDDAKEFLFDYLEQVPIIIVTAGDDLFQREKIRHLGFFPNEILVVPAGTSKLDSLKDLYRRYEKTIFFVDDNPSDLASIAFDAWFGSPPGSYRVRMRREDSPHEHVAKGFDKLAVSSFDQLREVIPLAKEKV